MRAYYTDYVNHMLKNYVGRNIQYIQNEVDRTNWKACDNVMRNMPDNEVQIIRDIYGRVSYKDQKPLSAAVQSYCDETGQDFGITMNLVRRVTKLVKKERGL